MRKPNLSLIASKCAVSRMTVSRVLRNAPNVSPQTREFVLRVAEKMGFRPSGCYNLNQHASTKNCAILFQPEYSQKDAFFSGIILSVQRKLFEEGYDCSLGIVKSDYSEFLKLNRMLRSRRVHGVLVVGDIPPSYVEVLRDNFLNLVLLDYPGDPGMDQPCNAVCVENFHGAHLALNHLLKLGRKRILLILGREGHYFSNDLLRAYKEAMAHYNLELDSRLLVTGDFHINSGFKAVKAVLEAGISFDGVFSNDEMACGAIKALKQSKLRIPQDVSVVGFDGLPIGEVISPALTTVVVDREKMGRLAVRRLLALEQETSDDEKVEKVCIFPELLVRESCGFSKSAVA
jgi:LacI family repressor for deo operon, udp, cdd, tsx, nupC, and nupG